MIHWLKIIRPVNLLIIVFTMSCFRWFYFYPNLKIMGIDLALPDTLFLVFMLAIVCIGASGYIFNDLIDVEADRINKPQKTHVGTSISKKQTIVAFCIFSIVGIVLAIVTAIIANNYWLLLALGFGYAVLILYSLRLKSIPLVGNIAIACYAAFIPLLTYFFDIPLLDATTDSAYTGEYLSIVQPKFYRLTLFFTLMAFLTTFAREILKDQADVTGDAAQKVKTIATQSNPAFVKLIVTVIIALCIVLIWSRKAFWENPLSLLYFGSTAGIFLVLSALKTLNAKENKTYYKAGNQLKLAMFFALLYFPLFHFLFQHHNA